jgi:hypothetical protein
VKIERERERERIKSADKKHYKKISSAKVRIERCFL